MCFGITPLRWRERRCTKTLGAETMATFIGSVDSVVGVVKVPGGRVQNWKSAKVSSSVRASWVGWSYQNCDICQSSSNRSMETSAVVVAEVLVVGSEEPEVRASWSRSAWEASALKCSSRSRRSVRNVWRWARVSEGRLCQEEG